MDIDLLDLLAAVAGGFFGAAIGALQSFVFTGLVVLLGLVALMADPESTILSAVAFGPVFGPHVAFAGGVAAAAYAARGGAVSGKDIVSPLAKLARPDVLLVGALFGVLGYLVQKVVVLIPWFGTNTDAIALTVVLSGIAARVVFGSPRRVITPGGSGASGWAAYTPSDEGHWIPWQEKILPNSALGACVGLLSAFVTLALLQGTPQLGSAAGLFMFGISGVSLLFLSLGMSVPVTHHITLPSGVAAAAFAPLVGGALWIVVVIGAAAGMLGAWLAEFFNRLWHAHGSTHIDPPASAIWPATTIVLGASALVASVG